MNYKRIYNLIVFDNGTIYREFKTKCKLIKGNKSSSGYLGIEINGKQQLKHRVIMEAFYGKSNLVVDHIDGNKFNNSLDNLEYVTQQENIIRAVKNNLREKVYINMSKKVLWNGKIYDNAKKLSIELGYCDSYVSQRIKRKQLVCGYEAKFI